MAPRKTLTQAVKIIERHGVCLVFPIDNARAPASLWYDFYPQSKMRWEWDDNGDTRVADLWHLREQLSRSQKVVYAKWYRGRATFFSLEMASRFMAALNFSTLVGPRLSPDSLRLLRLLEETSPLSTKELKAEGDFKGKAKEGAYTRALKALWDRLLIVGFGEVDDGAFPSLAVGATESLFEKVWAEAKKLKPAENEAALERWGQMNPVIYKYFERARKGWAKAVAAAPVEEKKKAKEFVWPGVFKD